MRYFTKQQIDEIRKQLATLGIRDTDLITASTLRGNEYVAIVQDGTNKKISLAKMFEQFMSEEALQNLVPGKSAFELAQEEGFSGTLQEWLASLVGPQGPQGPQGPTGPQGPQGPKGDPGTGNDYTLPAATNSALGGIKTGYSNSGSNTGVKLDASNKAYITVPQASSSGLGGFKTGFDESGENYAVKLDGSGKAYVTVPAGSGGGSGGSGGSGGGGGESGTPGGHWDQAFCGTASESTVPTVPAAADPLDGTYGTYHWSHDAPTNASGGYVIWQVVRWVGGDGTAEAWQGPWRISGPDGDAGIDGTQYEYIYTRTNSQTSTTPSLSNTTPQPQNSGGGSGLTPADDDFVPLNWYDNPQGVYDVDGQRIEWMAFRKRNPQRSNGEIVRDANGNVLYEWSSFVGPILWSAYGKSGMDGDGVEYIFTKGTTYPTDNPHAWQTSASGFQDREYIPYASQVAHGGIWQDDPYDLTNEQPGTKQWMAMRRKYADTVGGNMYWHAYSDPKLWNYAPKDGDAGIGVFADFDNEIIAVGLNSSHNNVALDQSSNITLYNGIGSAASSAAITSVKHGTTDLTTAYTNTHQYVSIAAGSGHAHTVTVNIPANTIDLSTYPLVITVTLTATINGTAGVTRSAVLQVIGVDFGSDGHSYNLNLGYPVIKKRRNGQNIPAVIEPVCDWVSGETPQTPFTPTSPATNFTFEYSIDDATASSCPASISTTNIEESLRVVLKYNGMLVDQETLFVIEDGSNGEDVFRLDLDNENDTLLYTEDGTLVSGSATATATLYQGGTPVPSGVTYSLTSASGCTYQGGSAQASINSSTGAFVLTGVSSSGWVMVAATYNTKTYYAKFTFKKQIGGIKYSLLVTPNAIAHNTTTNTLSSNTITVHARAGAQTAGGGYAVTTLQTLDYSSVTGGMYIAVDDVRVTTYASGSYTFNVDSSKASHKIQLIRATISTSTVTEILDEETVPICKSANGANGTNGSNGLNGKDALPIRLRPWSKVDRTASGATPLVGDDRIFSGYEDNAPFRDVIILTPEDYEGSATTYPFTDNNQDMPTALIINFSSTHASGNDGTDIVLPYGYGGSNSNYTETIATSKAMSQALYDGGTGITGKMWGVFLNFGAIFTSLLVATQAYIGNLTVRKLNTGGDSSTSRRVVAENNTLVLYDDNNAQKMRITGDDLSAITASSQVSFPAYNYALNQSEMTYYGGFTQDYTGTGVTFTVSSGAILSIPSVEIIFECGFTTQYTNNYNNGYLTAEIGWLLDGEEIEDEMAYGYFGSQGYYEHINLESRVVNLDAGTHTLKLYGHFGCYGPGDYPEGTRWRLFAYTNRNYTLGISYADQKTEVGANGFQVAFGSDKLFRCMKDSNNEISFLMQSDDYGIEVKSNSMKMLVGGTWYNVTRDSSTGALKLNYII